MDSDFTLFVVDDDKMIRNMLAASLSVGSAVELFDSAESCLERLAEKVPDLFLLDVGLPGMDGYELCREIKRRPATENVPVIFVSAHVDMESRLAGYDAGGEDFVIKPYGIAEIQHKVERVRRALHDKSAAAESESEAFVALVLSNLDEYARLIGFLRTLNECTDYRQVAGALLQFLKYFRLEGVVQVRLRGFETTLSEAGENRPLEVSVVNHVRTLERIFEFRTRAAYNFDYITVMVNNMPVGDTDLCGRIRDNIAIATESADAKLRALQSFDDRDRTRREIHGVLKAISDTIDVYSVKYNTARYKGAILSSELLDGLLGSIAHVGLNTAEEDHIVGGVRARLNTLIDLYDIGDETQATLQALGGRIENILTATDHPHTE